MVLYTSSGSPDVAAGKGEAGFPPRIAAWALLDTVTTTLLKFGVGSSGGALEGQEEKAVDAQSGAPQALGPVYSIVVMELDTVATQMESVSTLKSLHEALDRAQGQGGQELAEEAEKEKSKKKGGKPTFAPSNPNLLATKLDSAVEFGIVRAAAAGTCLHSLPFRFGLRSES